MLYKEDFEKIAAIIKEANEDLEGGTPGDVVARFISDCLADYLETQNPAFHRGKFLRACGRTVIDAGE